MSGKKKLLTRRQRALRAGLSLAVLALLTFLIPLYHVFPGQAVQAVGDWYGLAPLRTVLTARLGEPLSGADRLYLAENEDALVAALLEFRLLSGWDAALYEAVDCSESDSPWCGLIRTYALPYAYVFGRVDDPDVKEITFRAVYRPSLYSSLSQETVLTVDRASAKGVERDWYFLSPLPVSTAFDDPLLCAVYWRADGGAETLLWELGG